MVHRPVKKLLIRTLRLLLAGSIHQSVEHHVVTGEWRQELDQHFSIAWVVVRFQVRE